jgi:uncharacterized protein YbaR (Trm112 family)
MSDTEAEDARPDGSPRPAGSLDPALLAILVCPLTRGPLRYDPLAEELISDGAQLAYPVRDGVPVMLVEEARFTG